MAKWLPRRLTAVLLGTGLLRVVEGGDDMRSGVVAASKFLNGDPVFAAA
jgi:hypothetical protein